MRKVYETEHLTDLSGAVIFVRVYYNREWDEYICRLYVNGALQAGSDGYEDDRVAAIGTAKVMATHRANQ